MSRWLLTANSNISVCKWLPAISPLMESPIQHGGIYIMEISHLFELSSYNLVSEWLYLFQIIHTRIVPSCCIMWVFNSIIESHRELLINSEKWWQTKCFHKLNYGSLIKYRILFKLQYLCYLIYNTWTNSRKAFAVIVSKIVNRCIFEYYYH